MANHDSLTFGFDDPPRGPLVRPVYWIILAGLLLALLLVYGLPMILFRAGYAFEAGRAKAADEELTRLDEAGVLQRSSALFRLASTKVSPSVVHIETEGPGRNGRWGNTSGLGTGVVIDKDAGYVVTNNHVVQDATKIRARLNWGDTREARLIGSDPKTDLAVIQVSGSLPAQAEWGNSDEVEIGDWVVAIGNPFGLDRTVTAGIVSATGRRSLILANVGGYEDWIQTDAAINPGNSGGPLVDMRGMVVGINTAILSETGGNQGVGLAIPARLAKNVFEQLVTNRRVVRGYLGVNLQPVDRKLADDLALPALNGAAITRVIPDSPADVAGIKPLDVIVAIDGKAVADDSDLRNQVAQIPVGRKIELTVFREGQRQTFPVTVGELPTIASLGFSVRPLNGAEAKEAGFPENMGVAIDEVRPKSPAADAGLEPGMVLMAIGPKQIQTKAQCDSILGFVLGDELRQKLVVHVRDAEGRTRAVEIVRK